MLNASSLAGATDGTPGSLWDHLPVILPAPNPKSHLHSCPGLLIQLEPCKHNFTGTGGSLCRLQHQHPLIFLHHSLLPLLGLLFFFIPFTAWQDPNLLTNLLEGVSYESTWQTQYFFFLKKKTKLKKKIKPGGGKGGRKRESQQGPWHV